MQRRFIRIYNYIIYRRFIRIWKKSECTILSMEENAITEIYFDISPDIYLENATEIYLDIRDSSRYLSS